MQKRGWLIEFYIIAYEIRLENLQMFLPIRLVLLGQHDFYF